MSINKLALKIALLPLLVTLLPLPAAALDKPRMFGKKAPFKTEDLPANSRLRNQLESLPESTRQQAIRRLHKFTFPENDAQHLNVTPEGHIFYSDPAPDPAKQLPAAPLSMQQAAPQSSLALPAIDVFNLHSRPNSSKRVFLDFDGMTISGTGWNSEFGVYTFQAKPFTLDNDPNTFSPSERNAIAEIWHRISEDYAPFDIDVTTEEPASFDPTTGHVLFTTSQDANGVYMPANSASESSGGVAFLGAWGDADYVTNASPAFVYFNNLGKGDPTAMAEAGAHEFGHNLGLSHDGSYAHDVTPSSEYFVGLGTDASFVSWAPIMGASYYKHVTQWSKGEYAFANNPEDDIAIIGGQLGIRPDDHGNGLSNASQLLLDSDGKVTVSTPQTDPTNSEPDNKGIIQSSADIDMFFFDTLGGSVNLAIKPAWAAFNRATNRGANLDIRATLYDGNGKELAKSDPNTNTDATITATITAGRHYLAIEGVGNSVTPYSDYNSMGEYFISGTVPSPDMLAPSPNPMTWVNPPAMLTFNSITMTATTATDNAGIVQYRFMCRRDGSTCASSGWQASPTFVAKNIGKGTYRYAVKARDHAGNQTALSEEIAVVPSIPVMADDSADVAEDSFIIVNVLANDSDIDGGKLSITSFTQGSNGKVIRKLGGLRYKPNKNFNGSDAFSYTVTTRRGGIANANVSINITPVNDAPKAINDSVTVTTNGLIEILPLVNDTDIDGDTLSIDTVVSPGKKGTINSYNSSAISYTAGPSVGSDRLVYTISDGHGGTAKAVIGVRIIKPVITPP